MHFGALGVAPQWHRIDATPIHLNSGVQHERTYLLAQH